ncbi:MAG: hypothetical protein WD969_17105 [Paracoccaceae bacterium]
MKRKRFTQAQLFSLISGAIGGNAAGAALMAVVGAIKNMMAKS